MADIGKLGVEIELMAPLGKSREDLAHTLAQELGGKVCRFFHPQSEPSVVPDTPVFENLTLGFLVEDQDGKVLARCVDDLTLQRDLETDTAPQEGWYRVVSDDARFLRLVMRHCDASDPLEQVLEPMAQLFGPELEHGEGGMVRVADDTGVAVVLGATLPGERERPCELVTSPIEHDHLARIEALLRPAREMGFTVPIEGAIHLHFDAAPLCSPATFGNLVRFLGIHAEEIQARLATNSECTRLGRWPVEIFDVITEPDFLELSWPQAQERLREVKLVKFCDYNLVNMVHGLSEKHTFEVRVLPVWLEGEKIVEAAQFFAQILEWAKDNQGEYKAIPESLDDILHEPCA